MTESNSCFLLPSIDMLPLNELDINFFQEQEEKARKMYNSPAFALSCSLLNDSANPTGTVPKLKGAWSPDEDIKLKNAVTNCDPILWDIVAESVPGRSAIQCKERWLYRLHPEVKKSRFEKWEDDLIIKERCRVGNHWTLIANKLPGRTSCAVKNRWYSVLRNKIGVSDMFQF